MRTPRALSPPRLPIAILLLTFLTNTNSQTEKLLLCKQPGSQTCITWLLHSNDLINDIEEIHSKTNIVDYCGLSDLHIHVSSHRKFFKIKIEPFNGTKRTLICKRIVSNDHTPEWTEIARSLGSTIRVRRQGFIPKGRYRGQTQSQYLSIDRGNGKDEGKAEAHSAADSSRASVSGNSGMGQAQSQSIYDPTCDDCYGKSDHEVENLKRPGESKHGDYIPNSGTSWPNTNQGRVPNHNQNGGYSPPSSTGSGDYSPGTHGRNGFYRPSEPSGPSGTPGSNGFRPTGTAGGEGKIPTGTSGGGTYGPGATTGTGSYIPSGIAEGGGYSPGRTTGGYGPSGRTAEPGYSPIGTGGYKPSGTTGSGSYSPGSTTGGAGYRPSATTGDGSYNPDGTRGGSGYSPVEPTGNGGYIPNGSTEGRGYRPGGPTGPGGYNPSGTTGDRGYSPDSTAGGGYRPSGPAGSDGINPVRKPGDSSYSPSGIPGRGDFIPSENVGSGDYSPRGVTDNGGFRPSGTADVGGYNPIGTTGGGDYNPGGLIGGGRHIPNGAAGSGSYTPSGTGAGRDYSPRTTAGGGGFIPNGSGGNYNPSGTTPGGSYIPGGITDNRGYRPSGIPGGGKYNPIGTTGVSGPGGTAGSGGYPGPGRTSESGGYLPSGPSGHDGYSPGGLTGTGGYRPSGPSGETVYNPTGATDGREYNPIGPTGGNGYIPNGYSGNAGTRPNSQAPNGNERSSNTQGPGVMRTPDGRPQTFGTVQAPTGNWPIASGPYVGPGGNSYFCCILPNNGLVGSAYPNTYGTGNGAIGGIPVNNNQYGGSGIPNNLASPQTNLDKNGPEIGPSGRTYGTVNNQNKPNGFYDSRNEIPNEPRPQTGTNNAGGPINQYGVTGGPGGPNGPYGVQPSFRPDGYPNQFGKDIPGGPRTVEGPGTGVANAPGGPFLSGGANMPGGIYDTQNSGKSDGLGQITTGESLGQNVPMPSPVGTNVPLPVPSQYGTSGGPNDRGGYYATNSGPNSPGGQFGTGTPDGAGNHYNNGDNSGTHGPRGQYEANQGNSGPRSNFGNDNLGVGPDGSYRPIGTAPSNLGGPYVAGPNGGPITPGGQYGNGPYGNDGSTGPNILIGQYGKDNTGQPFDIPRPGISNGNYGGGIIGGPNGSVNPAIPGGSINLPTTNNYGTDRQIPTSDPRGGATNIGPNGAPYGPQGMPPNANGQLGNTPYYLNHGAPTGQNNGYGGTPQNYVDPNAVAIDGDDSEAEASVAQSANGTSASASSKGGNDKGRAQTNVHGTYTGTGSFQAQAEITGENKEAQSEVSGGKKGASSSAAGSGRNNKSQANVQLGSETGSVQTQSQSNGVMHSSNSQVQGSVKGGMADAQARGPGSTSSQAQIGFTPYKDKDKILHDSQQIPFVGGGIASAQSSGRTGQSQSQLHGTFKYGITYNGAAQSGASLDKEAVFPNRLSFERIDVFDKNDKNIGVDGTDKPQSIETERTPSESSTLPEPPVSEYTLPESKFNDEQTTTEQMVDETMKNSESRYSSHTHLDHHKTVPSVKQDVSSGPTLLGSRKSFTTNYDPASDYEFSTDKYENPSDNYDTDVGFDNEGNDATDVEQNEYSNYDEFTSDSPTHQSYISPSRKGIEVQQSLGGNSQQIVLGSLRNHNAEITQKNSERPDESKVYQPGERIPGTGGYTIPIGFTGSVKSVASKDKTYVVGSRGSPSQAQTVTLTPGAGKVKYMYPPSHGKYVKPKNLRSLHSPKDNNRYVSVSKSVTRDLDNENNIRKQYSHTYYTKSSSCGYFTFTCTMVSSAEGRKKVCKPKIPTNPDGSPIRC